MGQNTSTMFYCQLPAQDYKFIKWREYFQSCLLRFQYISTAQNYGSQIIWPHQQVKPSKLVGISLPPPDTPVVCFFGISIIQWVRLQTLQSDCLSLSCVHHWLVVWSWTSYLTLSCPICNNLQTSNLLDFQTYQINSKILFLS